MKNMLMGFDLGVNTRPMNPPKLLPGFCWSRFQVGAAQQGFSFKTFYYPIVGTGGLLAHWFLELRFALLSALSQQLCAAPKYLLRHGFIGSLSSFVDRIEMHTWMQMEGFFRVKHGRIQFFVILCKIWKNMSCDSSSSGESGRSHPLLAGHPEARIPRVGDGKLQGWGPDGSYKQPNGNDLEADSAPIAWQKHRDKLVRLRGSRGGWPRRSNGNYFHQASSGIDPRACACRS